jgi:hypothetical protein
MQKYLVLTVTSFVTEADDIRLLYLYSFNLIALWGSMRPFTELFYKFHISTRSLSDDSKRLP